MEVAASIVGLLTAAANVYTTLSSFLSACHDAPIIAQTTSDELRDFHYALLKLRDQVWQSKNITPLGRATTDTSQLILTLTSAMTTLAQVEKTLDPLLAQPKKMDYIRRIRWGLAESDLSKLLSRIQNHKLTLNLLLTIWLSESVAQAEASNDLLNDTLKTLLNPRYRSRLQPFDPSFYDSSTNDTLQGSTPDVTPGNTPGHISHTPTPFHLGAPSGIDDDNMSPVAVDKAFSIMSGKSLRSKLLNTKPYAGLKAFDSSAGSVLSSERATPWSEFTIGSNASVFSLPFTARLNSETKRISEVKEIHRLSLPIDGMTFYNDWRYPENNTSAIFPTGVLCTLLSIFGLKAKGPRTEMEFKYTNISSLLLRTMSRELALHRREGGTHSGFLKRKLDSGISQNDIHSIELLLFWSAQKRFGPSPSIRDELVGTFREAIVRGATQIVELFLEWGGHIEVLHIEPHYQIFDSALESHSLEIIKLLLTHGFDTEKGYGNPAYTPLQATAVGRYGTASVRVATCLLELGVDIEGCCKEEPYTPLRLAINSANYDIITILLARGANPEKGCGNPSCTPLQAAAMGQYQDSLGWARFLLDHGANIDGYCEEESRTPAELAMRHRNYEVLVFLIESGASLLTAGYDKPIYRPLQIAAMSRFDQCLDFAKFLLYRGANAEQSYPDEPRAPLELAMESGNLKMIAFLLARGANPERASYREPKCTPLQKAAMGLFEDSMGLAKCLLEGGANVDGCCELESRRPLELAIEDKNYGMVTLLLAHQANPEKGGGNPSCTPLQAAAMGRYRDSLGCARFLLEHGANIDGFCEEERRTPAELAMRHGNYEILVFLIGSGASLLTAGYDKPLYRPLQIAAMSRFEQCLDFAQFLLDRGADIEESNTNEPRTPVELAIETGNLKMIELLLSRGANPERASYREPKFTPLQKAAMGLFENSVALAKCLLEGGANVEGCCEQESRKPLELAIEDKNHEMVTLLFAHQANPEKGGGNPSCTPLQAAAMGRYQDSLGCARFLLEHGVNIDGYCEEERRTPTELAMRYGNHEVLVFLIDSGANLLRAGYDKPLYRPLQVAAMARFEQCLDFAQYLLERGENIEESHINELEPRAPLELAIAAGNLKMVALLLTRGADPERASYGTPSCTALQRAAMGASEDCVGLARCLLDNGANVEACCWKEDRLPLELAMEAGNLKMIALLLSRGANPDRASYREPKCTPLQKAAMGLFEDSVALAKCLLEGGANVEGCCEQESRKPLELAIENQNHEVVTLLLAHHASPEKGCGNPSCTPLQAAAMGQYQDSLGCARFLLEHGVNIDGYCEEERRTPTDLAMRHGNYEVLAFLIDSGANLLKAGYDKPLYRPLQVAAMAQFEQCLDFAQFLLDRGADIEHSHVNELEPRAPLELAVEAGNLKMIALLLACGANPDRASYGKPSCTVLQRAAMGLFEDSVGIATCLLANGANVEACCWKEDRLPLELAIEGGNYEMITLLLARGANPERTSYREPKCTPLQKAAMGIFKESVGLTKCLLEGGANVEGCCEEESRKPLELAIEYRNYGIIEVLMGCGADPNQGYRCTPLQTLAKDYLFHTTHFMNLLLAGKPNVEGCTETENRTPLQIAIDNRDHEMVKLLLSCGADISKPYAGSTETPIGKVIGDGDLSMLKTLLSLRSDMERGHGSPQRTPLQLVVQMRPINALDMLSWLLDSGANIDGHTDQEPGTPLDIAIRAHNITLAQYLVARGASIEEWSDDALKESTVDRDLN